MRWWWVLVLPGCALAQDDVDALLARGQAEQALAALAPGEAGVAHEGARGQASYGLRRGLAHLGLGDREAARWWLGHARARLESDPGALSAADRARLLDALRGLADGPLRGAGAH